MKVRPTAPNIVVLIDDAAQRTKSGLYLQLEAKQVEYGTVESSSYDLIKAGDKVIVPAKIGQPLGLPGVDKRIVHGDDVLAIVEE